MWRRGTYSDGTPTRGPPSILLLKVDPEVQSLAANVPPYVGDIGVPLDPSPMDFNAWFEAYLGGRWFTFDPRHNRPRIGRILIARGRDAADIPMITTFGS